MTREEKAALIGEILDELYPSPAVPLGHRDAFTLLVATVLSAQCTDKRVNERIGDINAIPRSELTFDPICDNPLTIRKA